MTTQCQHCVSDDDFAKASLFLMARKRDLHPAYSTLEMVTLLYSYITQGQLLCAKDDSGCMVGVAAYYCGTPEQEFQDKDVAWLDIAIFDQAYRRSRLFLRGMQYIVKAIMRSHPEVQEIRLAALAENDYLCRLYAKIATARSVREGSHGKEVVFCEKVHILRDTLSRFSKV